MAVRAPVKTGGEAGSGTITKTRGKGSEFLSGVGMGYRVGIRPCWSKSLPMLTKEMMRRSGSRSPTRRARASGPSGVFVTVIAAIPAAFIAGTASIEGATYLVGHMLRK